MYSETSVPLTSRSLPPPETIKRFLDQYEQNGPTVPHNLHKGLAFCREWLGVSVDTGDCLLAPYRTSPKMHLETQRDVLELSSWKHLLTIAQSSKTSGLAVGARALLRLTVSSLRMAHANRALLQRKRGTPRMQVWRISMGKDGSPFFISTPTHVVPRQPMFAELQAELDARFGADPPIFLPKLEGIASGVATISEGRSTHSQVHCFLRAILQLPPLSLSDQMAAEMTSQSLRRYMASAADALMMSPDRKDSLGNWKDSSGAASRKEPMNVRYSSERLKTNNETKLIVLAAIHHLATHSDVPTFERLRAVKPHLEKITTIVTATGEWGPGCEQLPAPENSELDPSFSDLSEDSDTSVSSGGEGPPSEDESRPLEEVGWISPLKGMIHLARPEGGLSPLCSRREFRPGVEQGTGCSTALMLCRPWCPRCLIKTEPSLAMAISHARQE
jgi:hypothetical protein